MEDGRWLMEDVQNPFSISHFPFSQPKADPALRDILHLPFSIIHIFFLFLPRTIGL